MAREYSASPVNGRSALDVVFGLLLLSGAGTGIVFLMILRNLVDPQGEGAFGIYIYGLLSFIPTVLAWVAGGILTVLGSPHRDVRRSAAVTTAHLVWWALVVGLLMWLSDGPDALIKVALLEPGFYAAAAIFLGLRWFRTERGTVSCP